MAKNRNKKNKANKGGGATVMDTSEGAPAASTARWIRRREAAVFGIGRAQKIKKGVQIKRSQNVRKMKAVARAISKNEKAEVKVLKAKSKKSRAPL
ncbi:hypothetical protein ABZP36_002346 [Zizania latifolia]